ncbi:MAG: HlyD family efflux transporter periplasmic adaptor subunit [Phycisphaerales bacterium]|jgi:RND family efflux transporter MFP subunit|nr:HlyD family efflux transporter periplasmic adaptor subunit [Phycisphaerales bacterium]
MARSTERLQRRGSVLRWAAGGVVAVIAVGALAMVVLGVPGSGGGAAHIATSDVGRAQVASFSITTTASGELEAKNQIEIRSKLESRAPIMDIVPEGTRLQAGDVICRLNGDDIQTQIDEEQLRVESSRAELVASENAYEIQVSENKSQLDKAKLELDLAELTLRQWEQGDHKKEVERLDLNVETAERQVERLREKFDKSKELMKQGFLSLDQYKQDEISLIEAEARLSTAKLERAIYLEFQYPKDEKTKRSAVDEAQSKLERTEQQNEIQLTSKEADRTNKRRQLSIREDRLAKLNRNLENCTISAPSGGLVVYSTSLERNRWGGGGDTLQPGREVSPNELIVVLPDTSEMVASVRIHESLAGRIRPGQRAEVKIEAAGARVFPGRVESIGVLAESGGWRDPNRREYTVKVSIDAGEFAKELKPSMRCDAEIELGAVEEAVAVPVQAVFADGMVRYVLVPEDGKFARVPVRLGRRSSVMAEVTSGLKAGEMVLLREPRASEVLRADWSSEQLASVGLKRDEAGQIMPDMPSGGPAGGPAMRPTGGQGAPRGRGEARGAPGSANTAKPADAQAATQAKAADGGGDAKASEGDTSAAQSPAGS